MIVIANQTEFKLLKDLREHVKNTPAQKCFFIEFSKSDLVKKELFAKFLGSLEELPNAYMAQVYLCEDKDIFILMQGFMQRHFLEFIKKLSIELNIPNILNIVEIFEIGLHWVRLENICKAKIENIDLEQERLAKIEFNIEAQKSAAKVFENLDANLISDISQRRDMRDEIRILIVDDDQLARTLVGNVLKSEFAVSFAHDGAEALNQYIGQAPDVVFLDIGLPDISGHDVLKYLFLFDPSAYVIMFSGRKDKANIVRALEAGALGFVGKPFTRDRLFEYIQKSPFVMNKKHLL